MLGHIFFQNIAPEIKANKNEKICRRLLYTRARKMRARAYKSGRVERSSWRVITATTHKIIKICC